jgi:hypothetical protein
MVDWQVIASDGDVLYSHQASYTLVRIDGSRIVAIARRVAQTRCPARRAKERSQHRSLRARQAGQLEYDMDLDLQDGISHANEMKRACSKQTRRDESHNR